MHIGSLDSIFSCDAIYDCSLRFIYDFVINDGPDPRDRKTLCDKIIKENVAIVKVEMPTKSLTRYMNISLSVLTS